MSESALDLGRDCEPCVHQVTVDRGGEVSVPWLHSTKSIPILLRRSTERKGLRTTTVGTVRPLGVPITLKGQFYMTRRTNSNSDSEGHGSTDDSRTIATVGPHSYRWRCGERSMTLRASGWDGERWDAGWEVTSPHLSQWPCPTPPPTRPGFHGPRHFTHRLMDRTLRPSTILYDVYSRFWDSGAGYKYTVPEVKVLPFSNS